MMRKRRYWTAEQTEWATDIVFRDAESLRHLYQRLVRHGIDTFQSPDVLRFLGHRMPAHGGINGQYEGDVMSDLKRRHEGVRIKHGGGKNSVKMYMPCRVSRPRRRWRRSPTGCAAR